MRARLTTILTVGLLLTFASPAAAGYTRSFGPGSLVIPLDLAYQDSGMFQAYGLVFQLLRQGVRVYWVIDPAKTWHDAACDTAGDECAWDCAEQGSGVRCPYPTASPDFTIGARVVWDGGGAAAGTVIASHGYRGGPFVIDAGQVAQALPIIAAWNDMSLWPANPWAQRSVFHVVTVHEMTAALEGNVQKEMLAAPTIAVFSDGNEQIATGYLRAAGIPQSNGAEFPAARCAAGACGPGTANPDMLTVESIMGEMGTCDAPNVDHQNGSLFTADGVPAYCQIMSMHWAVNDRETVQCDGGGCPATQAECAGETFTYHGHEVVAEVRAFLGFPTHFFAECQAVNAYENTVPNPAWPFLDDAGRNGHFLTTTGLPPDCPCTDGAFQCVVGGCAGRDCCLPRDVKERGAGFMIAAQPDENTLQILSPDIPYNQLDGFYGTIGGSEPAYNLSTYLGTTYIGDADVTFITGPAGPGDQDVWMTGYLDGVCDIGYDEFRVPGMCALGKVSYLGGHEYGTNVPLSANRDSQGTRLFLNALFEADCVTTAGQPTMALGLTTSTPVISPAALPADGAFTVTFGNTGAGAALDTVLTVTAPAGITLASTDGVVVGNEVSWDIGSVGRVGSTAPPAAGVRSFTATFTAPGAYDFDAALTYRVGGSTFTISATTTVRVATDRDGDGVPDDTDPFPDDATRCGDADASGCDDCAASCPGVDGGVGRDAGTTPSDDGGCGCRAAGRPTSERTSILAAAVAVLLAGLRRRARRRVAASTSA